MAYVPFSFCNKASAEGAVSGRSGEEEEEEKEEGKMTTMRMGIMMHVACGAVGVAAVPGAVCDIEGDGNDGSGDGGWLEDGWRRRSRGGRSPRGPPGRRGFSRRVGMDGWMMDG